MLERFKQHIQTNFPYLQNSKILVGISGGLDSVVLTHFLYKLKFAMALAHVNYQLRAEESNLDEFFVKKIGDEFKVPVFVQNVDTNTYATAHKVSIQMAAREIRYKWFDEVMLKHDYDYILTAHHRDDSIETFFINLNRSTGLEGLTGIPEKNDKIVRPFLIFSRVEIEKYAIDNKLVWREDASNATTKYQRNKIRHQLLPVLQEINPKFTDAFATTQSHLKGSQSLVDDYISLLKSMFWKESNKVIKISLKEFLNLPNIKAVLYEFLKDFGFTQWEDVYQLPQAQTGKQVFSETHSLLKDRDFLVLSPLEKKQENEDKRQVENEFRIQSGLLSKSEFRVIDLPKTHNYKTISLNEIYFDKNKAKFPLFVRKWQKGDYFYPLGMQGKKKLSDFLIDQKISLLEKEKIWLLCDANDKIIWVIGKRLDNRFRITEETTKIIKIFPNNEEII